MAGDDSLVPTEIPGQRLSREAALPLQKHIQELLNCRGFAGAQPISFERRHLDVLLNENYFVAEKADGIRVLLYSRNRVDPADPKRILGCEGFLIDRKNDYYYIPTGFLTTKESMMDGELVYDIRNSKKVLLFLAFDCLVADGEVCTAKSYEKRTGVSQMLE
jgi:mRNA guanylyltransferase